MRPLQYSAALAATVLASIVSSQDCPTGYSRSIDWKPCPSPKKTYKNGKTEIGSSRLQCGVLEVPLDWKNVDIRTMRIPLVRIPASGKRLNQSVIVNPGGPGESGVDTIAFGGDELLELYGTGYDIIGFDPRGVGLSKPFDGTNYDCPSVTPYSNGPFETSADIAASYKYNVAQAQACEKAPYLTKSQLVGTAYVARDVVAIAQALGQDNLVRYYGYSYGTLIGATLATMFPEKMDKVVLDGNINPYDYYFGNGDEAVADVDRAVAHYFEECSKAGPPKCNLTTAIGKPSGPQLQAQFNEYLDILYNRDESEWYAAKGEIFQLMRGPSAWNDYADGLSKLKDWKDAGRAVGRSKERKRQVSVTVSDVGQASVLTSQQDTALAAISCSDYQGKKAATVNDFNNVIEVWNNRSYYGGDQLVTLQLQCIVWNTDAREQYPGPYSNPQSQVKTKNPILFINGRFDPVTPLVSAQGSAKGFAGAVVLQSNSTGHCSSAHISSGINSAITQYFATGKTPVGTAATKIYEPDEGPFDVFYEPRVGGTAETVQPGPAAGSSLTRREIPVLDELMQAKRDTAMVGRNMAAWSIPIGCKPSKH